MYIFPNAVAKCGNQWFYDMLLSETKRKDQKIERENATICTMCVYKEICLEWCVRPPKRTQVYKIQTCDGEMRETVVFYPQMCSPTPEQTWSERLV